MLTGLGKVQISPRRLILGVAEITEIAPVVAEIGVIIDAVEAPVEVAVIIAAVVMFLAAVAAAAVAAAVPEARLDAGEAEDEGDGVI